MHLDLCHTMEHLACKNKMTLQTRKVQLSRYVSKLPSATVPDDAWTVKQLFERMAKGLPLDRGLYRVPRFEEGSNFDSPDLEELGRMELAERHEYLEALRADMREAEAQLKKDKEFVKEAEKLSKQKDPQEPPEAAEEGEEGKPEVSPQKTKDVKKTSSTIKKDSSS